LKMGHFACYASPDRIWCTNQAGGAAMEEIN
jgi:hypothetical protein